MKPYRSNQVRRKLRAERARLARVYASQAPSKVKEHVRDAGRALTKALKALDEERQGSQRDGP